MPRTSCPGRNNTIGLLERFGGLPLAKRILFTATIARTTTRVHPRSKKTRVETLKGRKAMKRPFDDHVWQQKHMFGTPFLMLVTMVTTPKVMLCARADCASQSGTSQDWNTVHLRFQSCEPKFGLLTTRRLHVSRRRAGSRTSQLTLVHVHVDDVELREDTGVVCPSSWTVRLFDVVVSWMSSSSLWTSPLRDAESRAAKEHRSCLGRTSFRCWSINLVSRSHLSAASFCFDDQSGGILVKKKKSGSLAHSLSSSLQCYRIMLLSFLKKKKIKRRGGSSSSEEDRYMRVLVKPSGLHFVSSIQVWNCERRSFHSAKGIYVRKARVVTHDSTNDAGSTWSFLLVARHAATLRLWRANPWVGELPFLKGFSLWTDQSERVYFYWPPGPNPVVTISTRVGPGSRLTFGVSPC